MSTFPFISVLTLLPVIGGILVIGLGAGQKQLARRLALAFSLASLALAVVMWVRFDTASSVLQFDEQHGWIPTLAVQYHGGVDGLGLLWVMLWPLVWPLPL